MKRKVSLSAILLLYLVFLFSLPAFADFSGAVQLYNARNYGEAFKEFSTLSEEGSRDAQTYLGGMYRDGTGVKQDYAAAFSWYRKSAEQGSSDAQINLGFMYEKGLGIGQSWGEALRWYRMEAEQGHVQAQTSAGYLLQAGLGANRDDGQALKWFQRAADQARVGQIITQGNTAINDLIVNRHRKLTHYRHPILTHPRA